MTELHEPLEHHARQKGDKVAVVDGDRNLSYAEWNEKSNHLAEVLRKHKLGTGDRVGLWLNNGADAMIGMMAILKCGAVYVPLNPDFPEARLKKMVQHSEMKMVIGIGGEEQVKALLEDTRVTHFIELSSGEFEIKKMGGETFKNEEACQGLCYIMYTSGTTGDPKGVMITHQNVQCFLSWAVSQFNLTETDRFSSHPRINFDLSVFDIFACLKVGGTLYPVTQPGDLMFPGTFIEKHAISIWFSVPSVLGMMIKMQQVQNFKFTSLRHFLVCGEALNPDYAREWVQCHSGISLWNLYGPTEATIACTFYKVDAECLRSGEGIPIGTPMPGTEILIVDEEKTKVCAEGTIGALMICGKQLSPGYWKNSELTDKAFLPHLSGQGKMYLSGDLAVRDERQVLHYKGRLDQQIQWMGYRVELTEIESVLSGHATLHEVSVVFIDGDVPRLIAAVVADEYSDEELQQHMKAQLPDYMVPREIISFDALPKNSNGKIDRKQIAQMILKA